MRVFYSLVVLSLLFLASCSSDDTETYRITGTPVPSEAGTVTPAEGEFEKDRAIEVSATPNEHWVFDHWEGDYEGTENPVVITMDTDKELAAFFVKRDYPLNIEITGEGSVSERIVQQKTEEYPHGTVVELTAEPEEGWEFDRWEGDLEGSENPETVTIEGETTVTAVFARIEYPLTIHTEGEGRVDEEIVSAKATDYPEGTVVRLTAEPDENWAFSHWEGDLEGSQNPETITMDEPKEVTAVFVRTYRLTTVAEPEEGGEITPEAGSYVRDTTFNVEAVPSPGWEFVRWEGDFTGPVNPFSLTMNGDKTLVAYFERVEYVLETEISGEGEVQTDLISGTETDEGFLFESEVELTAEPADGWRFVRWEGDLEGSENPATLVIDENKSVTAIFTFFEGGEGTEADPYQVSTVEQLQKIGDYPDGYFILINDIDASDTQTWNGGEGFEPIGDAVNGFNGGFDGNGYIISGLVINRPDGANIGLFGAIAGSGAVANLTLQDVAVSGDLRTGGVAGQNAGRIEEVTVIGEITGNSDTGGITGRNTGTVEQAEMIGNVSGDNQTGGVAGLNEGDIFRSNASADIDGGSFRAGGLTGTNEGTIEESYATGNVSANNMTGGFTGWNTGDGIIRYSFALGDVNGQDRAGGFAGRNDGGSPRISDSYALGDVSAVTAAGGFAGTNGDSGEILYSYSAGGVSGSSDTGGFAGTNSAEITGSYWNVLTSMQTDGTGLGEDSGTEGLTTVEMTGEDAPDNMTEFNWTDIWKTTTEYPALFWED